MPTQDRVGQQFGNYRLARLIGSGGYAEVYLAEHVAIPNLIRAIKVLTGTNLKDEQREQFKAEASTIAGLQRLSTHIVQIDDFGIQTSQNSADDGVPYIVMEYAAEGTLRHLYPQNTQVPLERIAFYTKQVAEALQCAHDQNPPIVHLDIKPENMLLRSRDHLLLSDFGIAITGNTNSLTAPLKDKDVLGTVSYLAPERLSKQTRRASDQYSLGIVVYEWLCGSLPFDGTEKEILYKQLIMPPPPLSSEYPHITQEIEDVVMRALAKEPADRYPNMEEFAYALASAIQKTSPQNQSIVLLSVQQATPPHLSPPGSPPQAQSPLVPLSLQRTATPHLSPSGSPPQAQPPIAPLSLQWTATPHLPPIAPLSLQQAMSATLPVPKGRPAQQQLVLPMVSLPQQPVTPRLVQPGTQSTLQIRQGVQNFFALSPRLASTRRSGFFEGGGIILNFLSALTIGLLQRPNTYLLFGGAIFSFAMFWLCIHIIEEKLALFFGALVALYWGFVGWEIGNTLASSLNLDQPGPPLFMGTVFLVASLILHIWYILRKNS